MSIEQPQKVETKVATLERLSELKKRVDSARIKRSRRNDWLGYDDEQFLIRVFQEGREAEKEISDPERFPQPDSSLMELSYYRDLSKEIMFSNHRSFIIFHSKKRGSVFAVSGFQTLVEGGKRGMIKAMDRWSFEKGEGNTFLSTAGWYIKMGIDEEIAGDVGLSRGSVTNIFVYLGKTRRFIGMSEEKPSIEELAEVAGVSVQQAKIYENAYHGVTRMRSFQDTQPGDSGDEAGDKLLGRYRRSDRGVEEKALGKIVESGLSDYLDTDAFTVKERKMVKLVILDGYNQSEASAKMGFTRSRGGQVYHAGLKKLRHFYFDKMNKNE